MVNAVLRYAVPLVAAVVIGPVTGRLIEGLASAGGEADATALTASPVWRGVLGGAAVLLGGLIAAAAGARAIGRQAGLTAAGYAVGVAAWFGASPAWLWREQASAGLGVRLVVEGVLVAAGVMAIVVVASVLDRGRKRGVGPQVAPTDLKSPAALAGSVAGAAAACAVAWFVAQDSMRGQALFAAFLGGIAAGVVSRMVARGMDAEVDPIVAFGAGVLPAVLGPAVMLVFPGAGGAAAAVLAGSEPGLIHVQALDWAAGALLGVPIGLSWAGAHVADGQAAAAGAAAKAG